MTADALDTQVNLIQVAEDPAAEVRPSAPPVDGAVLWPVIERLLDGWPASMQAALLDQWALAVSVKRETIRRGRLAGLSTAAAPGTLSGTMDVGSGMTGLILIEPVCLYGVMEFILGDRSGAAPSVPDRPPTPFEAGLMRPLAQITATTFSEALAPSGSLGLQLQGWCDPAAAVDDADALVAALTLTFGGATGRVLLALPLLALQPVAASLDGVLAGRDAASASMWRAALAANLARITVPVTAVVFDGVVPLGRVGLPRVGGTITLDASAEGLATLRAGAERIATASMCRLGDAIAVRLHGPVQTGRGREHP